MSKFDIDFDAVETFTRFSRTMAARLIGAFSVPPMLALKPAWHPPPAKTRFANGERRWRRGFLHGE